MKAGKFANEDFNVKAVKYLYEQGLYHIQMREQWLRSQSFHLAAEYQAKAEAVAQLMEGVVVFHHGDGMDAFSDKRSKKKTVEERIRSFERLWKRK